MLENKPAQTQDPLIELMLLLQSVETDTSEAELNETSMSDNNGRRIKY